MPLLDFFTLEATEYVEHLDGLLARAGGGPPALDAFLTDAKALRGSATMARQPAIAEVAAGLERLAKALREATVAWNPAVQGTTVAAVDDLKILIRAVRAWGPADDQRAQARRDELARVVPARARASAAAMTPGGSLAYVAGEAADVAAALDSFAQQPADHGTLLAALPRVRALRGMASLRDLPPLAEVIDAVEDEAKPIELGAAPPSAAQLNLFHAAAALLRRAAQDLRAGGQPDPSGDEAHAFSAALDAIGSHAVDANRVVPIASLFFADQGPHVVSADPNPPTTAQQRFRMEVVSQAEHLLRLIGDARTAASDDLARGRVARALRAAVGALRSTSESFEQRDVAKFLDSVGPAAIALEMRALQALGEATTLLANPRTEATALATRLRVLAAPPSIEGAIGAAMSPVERGTPVSVAKTEAPLAPVVAARVTAAGLARGADLRQLLETGIAGLTKLDREPFSQPLELDEEPLPIDEFLYRGRAALDRAIEIRDTIRRRGGAPDSGELDELFALLELAATE